MDAYCAKICKLKHHFEGIEFQHVPRNNNMAADVLSKLGSRLKDRIGDQRGGSE
jgi:hypothetical protein